MFISFRFRVRVCVCVCERACVSLCFCLHMFFWSPGLSFVCLVELLHCFVHRSQRRLQPRNASGRKPAVTKCTLSRAPQETALGCPRYHWAHTGVSKNQGPYIPWTPNRRAVVMRTPAKRNLPTYRKSLKDPACAGMACKKGFTAP